MSATVSYDAIVIGAGISGMYQLHRLRGLGLSVRVFEAASGVGGTWYWNRYPGARFDSESWTYGYSFSEEILQRVGVERALRGRSRRPCATATSSPTSSTCAATSVQHARDHGGGRTTRPRGAGRSRPRTAGGAGAVPDHRDRAAVGADTMPNIPGVESFKGEAYHTGRWPHEPVTFEGKRVAVIGTGATGVQTITEIAKTVGDAHGVPAHAQLLRAAAQQQDRRRKTQAQIKSTYPEIFARCKETWGGFIHAADPRKALEVSEEEREAFYEKLYAEPGFGIWMGNFQRRDDRTRRRTPRSRSSSAGRSARG